METDYNTFTVVQLKEVFKSRGVPTTGLTRKQQLIDKLKELDEENAQETEADPEEEAAPVQEEQRTEVENVLVEEEVGEQEAVNNSEQATEPEVSETQPTPDPAEPAAEPTVETASPSKDLNDVDTSADVPTTDDPGKVAADVPMPDVSEPAPEATPATAASNEPSQEVEAGLPMSDTASVTSASAPEESRKRKRRSPTPPPPAEEVTLKRAKPNEYAPDVQLPEDLQSSSAQPKEEEQDVSAQEKSNTAPPIPSSRKELIPPQKYKELPGLHKKTTFELGGAYANVTDIADVDVAPSIHPATNALYFSEVVRPLNERYFKQALLNHAKLRTADDSGDNHGEKIAEAEGVKNKEDTDVDESVEMTDFYLDTIRSHGFVVFNSVAAASRVRTCLHGKIYPKDGDRKPLWIDFVPPEKVEGWISLETDAAERSNTYLRWEIVYEHSDDGEVLAELREAPSVPPYASQPRKGSSSQAPAQPRMNTAPKPSAPPALSPAFTTLNQSFKSTSAAKPMLYYLPVDEESNGVRTSELEYEFSGRYAMRDSRSVSPTMEKYIIEDDRVFFDGADYRNAPPGPRGGGPRGRGRGRWGGRY